MTRQTAHMQPHAGHLIGREREVEELTAALERARQGQGGVWLLRGEPGIGKSRLCEELARIAHDSGVWVSWGRCWEAGGAPAYWPWLQALRALWHRPPVTDSPAWAQAHRAALAQLIPEWVGPPERASEPGLSPDQARFLLFDGLSGALTDAARQGPLLVVLEDLHVADSASLAVLDLVLSQARVAPLMVLGTFRDAAMYASHQALAQLSHRARTLTLASLSLHEVGCYLRDELGHDRDAEQVYALCEGNPLFLVEMARLLHTHGSRILDGSPRVALDRGMRYLLRERLAALSPSARAVMEVVSVIGREARGQLAEQAHDGPAAEVRAAIREAIDASLLVELAPGQLRFTHILTRETLYHDLSPARRQRLHLRVADAMQARRLQAESVSAAELAHHLRAAGEPARERALAATLVQAEETMASLAFDTAAEAYAQALALQGELRPGALAERARLLVELARAELHAGASSAGHAHCEQAAELFGQLDDSAGYAEAALERGSVLHFGTTDPELVRMLQRASARLGDEPGRLQARVLARLAAASQPCAEPERAVELAQRSIDMARALGDEHLLLEVLLTASSALVDVVDARERRPINAEHALLAERLGQPHHAVRARTRMCFDCFDLGDLAEARASAAAVRRHAATLEHPLLAWPAVALECAHALYEGRCEPARACLHQLRAMAEGHPDPNLAIALLFQAVRLARLEDDTAALRGYLDEMTSAFKGSPESDAICDVLCAYEQLYDASEEPGHVRVSQDAIDRVLRLGDRTMLLPLAQLAHLRQDGPLAQRLDEVLRTLSHTHCSLGVMSMVFEGPLGLARGWVAALLGQVEAAEQWVREAFQQALREHAEPAAARIALGWGQMFERHASAMDGQALRAAFAQVPGLRAEPSVQRAVAALARRCEAQSAQAPPRTHAAPQPLRFSLVPDGEHYRLSIDGQSFALRATKGVRWLSMLISEPGREWHVLSLSAEGRHVPVVDRGDAGSVLDEQAVREYRTRVLELEQSIDEAEQHHDLARLEQAKAEREALVQQLSAAVGLGGRGRRAGSHVERARVNVQRRLKDAVTRIGQLHPTLGRHLERAVRTGVLCAYDPG